MAIPTQAKFIFKKNHHEYLYAFALIVIKLCSTKREISLTTMMIFSVYRHDVQNQFDGWFGCLDFF